MYRRWSDRFGSKIIIFLKKYIYKEGKESSIYHLTHILSQNRFASLEGIMLIIDFLENIHENTFVQLAKKHNYCARMIGGSAESD